MASTTSVNPSNTSLGIKLDISAKDNLSSVEYRSGGLPSYTISSSKWDHKSDKFPNTTRISSIQDGIKRLNDFSISKQSTKYIQPTSARTVTRPNIRGKARPVVLDKVVPLGIDEALCMKSRDIMDLYRKLRELFITDILLDKLRLTVNDKAMGEHRVFECKSEMIELSMGYFVPVLESHKRKIVRAFNKKFPEDNIPDDLRKKVFDIVRATNRSICTSTVSGSKVYGSIVSYSTAHKKDFENNVATAGVTINDVNEPVISNAPNINVAVSKLILASFYTSVYEDAQPSSMLSSPPQTKLAVSVNCDLAIFEWLYQYATHHYYKSKKGTALSVQHCNIGDVSNIGGGSARGASSQRISDFLQTPPNTSSLAPMSLRDVVELEAANSFKEETTPQNTTSATVGDGGSVNGVSGASHTARTTYNLPIIGVANVASLILSSDFLGMKALHREACGFFCENLGEVLLSDVNLDCLSDVVNNMIKDPYTDFLQPEHILEACLYIAHKGCSNTSGMSDLVAESVKTGSKEIIKMLDHRVKGAINSNPVTDLRNGRNIQERPRGGHGRTSSNGKKKKLLNGPLFNIGEAEKIIATSYEFPNRSFLGNLICNATVQWLSEGCCAKIDASSLQQKLREQSGTSNGKSDLKDTNSHGVVSSVGTDEDTNWSCDNKYQCENKRELHCGQIDFCQYCGVLFRPLLASRTGGTNPVIQRCPSRGKGIIGVHGELENGHVGRNQNLNIEIRSAHCFCRSKEFEALQYILLSLYDSKMGEMRTAKDPTRDANTPTAKCHEGWIEAIASIKKALSVKTCLGIQGAVSKAVSDGNALYPRERRGSATSDNVLFRSDCVDSIFVSESRLIPMQLFFKNRPVELLCVLLWMQLTTAAPTEKSIQEEESVLSHLTTPEIRSQYIPSTPLSITSLGYSASILLLRNHPILHTFSLKGFTERLSTVPSSRVSFVPPPANSITPWLLASRLLIPRMLEDSWSGLYYRYIATTIVTSYSDTPSSENSPSFIQHPNDYFIAPDVISTLYRPSASGKCKGSAKDSNHIMISNYEPDIHLSPLLDPANGASAITSQSLWTTLAVDFDSVKGEGERESSESPRCAPVVSPSLYQWSSKAIASTITNRRKTFAALLKSKVEQRQNRRKMREEMEYEQHKKQEDRNGTPTATDDGELMSSLDAPTIPENTYINDETVVNNEIMSFSPQCLLIDMATSRERQIFKHWKLPDEGKHSEINSVHNRLSRNDTLRSASRPPPTAQAAKKRNTSGRPSAV